MPTSRSIPSWFFWQQAEDLFTPSPRQNGTVLAEMIDLAQTQQNADYIAHELDEFVNILLHEDQTSMQNTRKYVGLLTQAIDVAKNKARSLQAQYKLMQDEVSANKGLIETLEKQIVALMQDQNLAKLELDNGVECKITKSPGALKASREPSEADLKELGTNIVRQSYAWNLVNLKAAIAEGVVDHAWMEKNGFTLVRNNSVKITHSETV